MTHIARLVSVLALALAGCLQVSPQGGLVGSGDGKTGPGMGDASTGGDAGVPGGDSSTTVDVPNVPPPDGGPVICPPSCDDGNPCTDNACDTATGQCVTKPSPDGIPCGACGAVCVAGACKAANAQCATDADCDDGDPCTDVRCKSCVCELVAALQCDDGNPCTFDKCDWSANGCVHETVPEGTSCGPCGAACWDGYCAGDADAKPGFMPTCMTDADCVDGDPCTIDLCVDECWCEWKLDPDCKDLCKGVKCDDGNPCTEDLCDPSTGKCHHKKKPDPDCVDPCENMSCDDGNPCTEDFCDPASGNCYYKTKLSPECGDPCQGVKCDDGDPCTDDVCDMSTGGCYSKESPDGTVCGPCGAICWNGSCYGNDATVQCFDDSDCDDGDPCTLNHCTDACLCDVKPIAGCGDCAKLCDDGNPCTNDYCEISSDGQYYCAYESIPGCGNACNGDDCDDGNPCTDDICSDAGICINPTVPPGTPCGPCGLMCMGDICFAFPGGCASNTDCEDGDPCTYDICTADCTCEHMWLENCDPCNGIKCDDGDPCTKDVCKNGQCTYIEDPQCTAPFECNSQGAIPIGKAVWTPMETVKVAGAPVAGYMYACDLAECSADNPCCNNCDAALELADDSGTIAASTVMSSQPMWSCLSDSCGETLSCSPPHHDTGYWVWGKTAFSDSTKPGFVPQESWLQVQGWCIQTTPAGLPGQYEGTIAVNEAGMESKTEVTMTIAYGPSNAGDIGWSIYLEPGCANCVPPFQAQWASDITIGDGWLSFALTWPSVIGIVQTVTLTLKSWQNNLNGSFGSWWASDADPMPIPAVSGELSVTKKP